MAKCSSFGFGCRYVGESRLGEAGPGARVHCWGKCQPRVMFMQLKWQCRVFPASGPCPADPARDRQPELVEEHGAPAAHPRLLGRPRRPLLWSGTVHEQD